MSVSKVKVINVTDPSNFSILIDDDGFLDKQLALMKVESLNRPVLQKDTSILCFDVQKNKWHRCAYIGTADELLAISHLVDEPGVFTCGVEYVYKLPESLRNIRPLLIKNCSINSGQVEWSPTQIERFKSIIITTSLTAEIFYSPQSNFIRLFANDRNIVNLLNQAATVLTSGKCHVLSVISANEIYILTHPMKTKLNFINESLTYMNAMSMKPVDNLKEVYTSRGMLVCYNSEVDAWYRAKIVKLLDNNSAKVFFIDCGSTVTAHNTPQSMRICSAELANYEPSVIACAYDSEKPLSQWTADDLNLLKSSIEGKVLYAKLSDKTTESHRPLVKFLNPNDTKKEMFQFPVVFYPYRRSCFDGTGYIIYYTVNDANRETDIFVQLKSDLVLSHMIEKRLAMYDKNRSVPIKAPRVGDLCVVSYEDAWYRASILSISSSNIPNMTNIPVYVVQLVDWGEIVEVADVYALHNTLLNAYPLAIKGRLYKFASLSEAQIQLIKQLTDNSTELLIRFIPQGKDYLLRILNEHRVDQFPPEHPDDITQPIPTLPDPVKFNDNNATTLHCGKLLYRPLLRNSGSRDTTLLTQCYIQLSSDNANESKLNSLLQTAWETLEMIPYGTDLFPGGACLVQMNDTLYRAVIVMSEADVDLVTVKLVDCGYSNTYKREELYKLPQDLVDIPPLAVTVSYSPDDVILSQLREIGSPILFQNVCSESGDDLGDGVLIKGLLGQCMPRYKEVLFVSFEGRVAHISKDTVYVVCCDETPPLLNSETLERIPDEYLIVPDNFDCVIQMPNSHDCARARITANSAVNNSEHLYTAYLLDRGRTIPVSRDQLRLLPGELYGRPPLAIPCSFMRPVTQDESILCQIVTIDGNVYGIMELVAPSDEYEE